MLQLNHNIFTALQTGTLAADQFVKGREPKDANDHLLYDRATGELAYDPDGNGVAAAVTIAASARITTWRIPTSIII